MDESTEAALSRASHLVERLQRRIAELKQSNTELSEQLMQQGRQLQEINGEFSRFLEVVLGWRECDWPEGFDRRTAELIADRVREQRIQGAPHG